MASTSVVSSPFFPPFWLCEENDHPTKMEVNTEGRMGAPALPPPPKTSSSKKMNHKECLRLVVVEGDLSFRRFRDNEDDNRSSGSCTSFFSAVSSLRHFDDGGSHKKDLDVNGNDNDNDTSTHTTPDGLKPRQAPENLRQRLRLPATDRVGFSPSDPYWNSQGTLAKKTTATTTTTTKMTTHRRTLAIQKASERSFVTAVGDNDDGEDDDDNQSRLTCTSPHITVGSARTAVGALVAQTEEAHRRRLQRQGQPVEGPRPRGRSVEGILPTRYRNDEEKLYSHDDHQYYHYQSDLSPPYQRRTANGIDTDASTPSTTTSTTTTANNTTSSEGCSSGSGTGTGSSTTKNLWNYYYKTHQTHQTHQQPNDHYNHNHPFIRTPQVPTRHAGLEEPWIDDRRYRKSGGYGCSFSSSSSTGGPLLPPPPSSVRRRRVRNTMEVDVDVDVNVSYESYHTNYSHPRGVNEHETEQGKKDEGPFLDISYESYNSRQGLFDQLPSQSFCRRYDFSPIVANHTHTTASPSSFQKTNVDVVLPSNQRNGGGAATTATVLAHDSHSQDQGVGLELFVGVGDGASHVSSSNLSAITITDRSGNLTTPSSVPSSSCCPPPTTGSETRHRSLPLSHRHNCNHPSSSYRQLLPHDTAMESDNDNDEDDQGSCHRLPDLSEYALDDPTEGGGGGVHDNHPNLKDDDNNNNININNDNSANVDVDTSDMLHIQRLHRRRRREDLILNLARKMRDDHDVLDQVERWIHEDGDGDDSPILFHFDSVNAERIDSVLAKLRLSMRTNHNHDDDTPITTDTETMNDLKLCAIRFAAATLRATRPDTDATTDHTDVEHKNGNVCNISTSKFYGEASTKVWKMKEEYRTALGIGGTSTQTPEQQHHCLLNSMEDDYSFSEESITPNTSNVSTTTTINTTPNTLSNFSNTTTIGGDGMVTTAFFSFGSNAALVGGNNPETLRRTLIQVTTFLKRWIKTISKLVKVGAPLSSCTSCQPPVEIDVGIDIDVDVCTILEEMGKCYFCLMSSLDYRDVSILSGSFGLTDATSTEVKGDRCHHDRHYFGVGEMTNLTDRNTGIVVSNVFSSLSLSTPVQDDRREEAQCNECPRRRGTENDGNADDNEDKCAQTQPQPFKNCRNNDDDDCVDFAALANTAKPFSGCKNGKEDVVKTTPNGNEQYRAGEMKPSSVSLSLMESSSQGRRRGREQEETNIDFNNRHDHNGKNELEGCRVDRCLSALNGGEDLDRGSNNSISNDDFSLKKRRRFDDIPILLPHPPHSHAYFGKRTDTRQQQSKQNTSKENTSQEKGSRSSHPHHHRFPQPRETSMFPTTEEEYTAEQRSEVQRDNRRSGEDSGRDASSVGRNERENERDDCRDRDHHHDHDHYQYHGMYDFHTEPSGLIYSDDHFSVRNL